MAWDVGRTGCCSGPNELHQSVCILLHFFHSFVFRGRSVTPHMDHENTFPIMCGRLLVQASQLPCKMMEGTMLRFVHCAARSTSPHFVVNVMKIIAQSVLTHKLVGTKLFIRHNTRQVCCAKGSHRFGLLCCAL